MAKQKFNGLTGDFNIVTNKISEIDGLQTELDNKADLVGGKVPTDQLPSYVDDVIEVADFASLPVIGEIGKIYITLDTGKTYRWSGTVYIELNPVDLSNYYTKTEIQGFDANNVHTTLDETIGGIKTFLSSPVVPTPTLSTQASTKGYVDGKVDILANTTFGKNYLNEFKHYKGILNSVGQTFSVQYWNGKFYTLGYNVGTVCYTSDGESMTTTTPLSGFQSFNLLAGPDGIISIANTGTAYQQNYLYSSNGTSWSYKATPGGYNQTIYPQAALSNNYFYFFAGIGGILLRKQVTGVITSGFNQYSCPLNTYSLGWGNPGNTTDGVLVYGYDGGIAYSDNSGQSYQTGIVLAGKTISSIMYNNVYKTFIAVTSTGDIYMSATGKTDWTLITNLGYSCYGGYVENDTMYISTGSKKLFVSLNGGGNWIELNTSIVIAAYYSKLAIKNGIAVIPGPSYVSSNNASPVNDSATTSATLNGEFWYDSSGKRINSNRLSSFEPLKYGNSYSELYMTGNSTATTLTTSGTWYKVAGTTTNGLTSNDFTQSSNRITVVANGAKNTIYKANASIDALLPSNTIAIEFGFSVNGGTPTSVFARVAESTRVSCNIQKLLTLNANDYVEVWAKCTNTNNTTVTVNSMSFTLN